MNLINYIMDESDYTHEISLDLALLKSKLITALEVARTRYKLESHSIWVKFFESIADIVRRVTK